MNLMDLPEDTEDDDADDVAIIAEKNPDNWERIAHELLRLAHEIRAGRMAPSPEMEHRGIIGAEVDGCIVVDIELTLMHVLPAPPSIPRRKGQKTRCLVRIGEPRS